MKTLKNTILAIGIAVGIITLSTSLSLADTNTEMKASKTAMKEMKAEMLQSIKIIENQLIENYLENMETAPVQIEKEVKIYNSQDELVYEGKAETQEAGLLLIDSHKLTEIEGVTFYIAQ